MSKLSVEFLLVLNKIEMKVLGFEFFVYFYYLVNIGIKHT